MSRRGDKRSTEQRNVTYQRERWFVGRLGAENGDMGRVRIGSKEEVGRRKRGIFMMEMEKGEILDSVPVLLNEGFSD